MKKAVITALALVMALSLTACGGRRNNNTASDRNDTGTANNSSSGNTMIENGMDNNADGGLMGELEDGMDDVIDGTERAANDVARGAENALNGNR